MLRYEIRLDYKNESIWITTQISEMMYSSKGET